MSRHQQFNTPFTSFIVKKLDEISWMLQQNNYVAALSATRNFVRFLDPPIKEKLREDIQELDEAIAQSLMGSGGMGKASQNRNQRDSLTQTATQLLGPLIDKLMQAVHEQGYFSFEKTMALNPSDVDFDKVVPQ